ncbi:hypothetical protein DFH06DRAFT_1083660 [Mycena polygramma]|nr:hypothetical protein DFH06DRAFT_1083655 [Mycena polygramma]KAJ7670046.1 hypothetical protein DFH06DRAFT_1083660 [Mycena polygramma]
MSLQQILFILGQHPSLSGVQLHGLTLFLRMARLARPMIEFQQTDRRTPPEYLHPGLLELLADSLSEPDLNLVQLCWVAFKGIVWDHPEVEPTEEEVQRYNQAALCRGTSFGHLFPPVRVCQDSRCINHRDSDDIMTLTEPLTHKASLYTLRNGALPVYTSSLYCRGCNRRYYHNYYVHKQNSLRTYYGGVPRIVQVAQHFFMESPLLELFANGMTFGWLSASNWARIYNSALATMHPHVTNNKVAFASVLRDHAPTPPSGWNLEIRNKDVMNGFLLYSLLLEKAERRGILVLPHDERTHEDRLKPALAERNKAMEGIGQEAYPHACDLCFFVFEAEDGTLMKIQTAHCDGDTIGHRCCKVHDCKVALSSNRQHFCAEHQHMTLKCAVTDCAEASASGFQTCNHPDHRALETAYFTRGKSLYKLRSRLKKAGVAVPSDSVPEEEDDWDDKVIIESGRDGPVEVDCDGKPEGGNRRLRAYFGSRRTHNEQLIMRCCGVILSRATLFGSEAVSAVNEFAKATFPSPESTPEFFVFDNNCKLDSHQRAAGDCHFENTGKPVDVFHFTCKHKLTDHHCQLYCNPAAFPELIDENGNWRFNTSICEQTNVWFGGYISLVRDMEVTRYNFFLDEMIKRRNRYVVAELERKGHSPWTIPMEALFPNSCQ